MTAQVDRGQAGLRRWLSWRVLGLLVLTSATASYAEAVPLANHLAVYDLKLAKSRKPSLQSVRGRILYDFTGNSCIGYTTKVRQVTEMDNGEGTINVSDLRSTTWEDDAGDNFRFNSTNYINDRVATTVDGEAHRTANGVWVTLKKPAAKVFRLNAATAFPTQQQRDAIAAARAGKTILDLPVYDGSDNGEKVYDTTAVIGHLIPPTVKPDDAAADKPQLAGVDRWHLHVSYFTQHGVGEQTPAYALAFEIYANGVSRALTLEYPDFDIAGKLTTLEFKPAPPCNKAGVNSPRPRQSP